MKRAKKPTKLVDEAQQLLRLVSEHAVQQRMKNSMDLCQCDLCKMAFKKLDRLRYA